MLLICWNSLSLLKRLMQREGGVHLVIVLIRSALLLVLRGAAEEA